MQNEDLKKIVMERTTDRNGRTSLACAQAFAISAELDISVRAVGDVCASEGIKICSCQLGCFK